MVLRLRGGGDSIQVTNMTTGMKKTITYHEGMKISELKNNI
jgi:hypothetical protein